MLVQLRAAAGMFVRPQLTDDGPIAIMEGRHPLVEQMQDTVYQPNDTFLASALAQSEDLHLAVVSSEGYQCCRKHCCARVIIAAVTADCSSFCLLGGPNMSGKSTCLRQVALITILAQVGCYVPAKSASLRATDHLLTSLGSANCLENNSSSFLSEMQAREASMPIQ
jgi:DNA mismatch repair ATPase MutS